MKYKSQSGATLIGVMVGGAVLVALLLVGLKLIPVISEFMGVKRSIAAVVAGANPLMPVLTPPSGRAPARAVTVQEAGSVPKA